MEILFLFSTLLNIKVIKVENPKAEKNYYFVKVIECTFNTFLIAILSVKVHSHLTSSLPL